MGKEAVAAPIFQASDQAAETNGYLSGTADMIRHQPVQADGKASGSLRFAIWALAAYVIAGGFTSFLGWAADIPRLTDWNEDGISIQPNTTIAVMAAGAAVLLLHRGYRRIAACFAALIAFIGVTAVIQIASRTDFGFNTILMFGREWGRTGVIVAGLMGTPGGASWSLIGIALLLVSLVPPKSKAVKQFRAAAVVLALISLSISTLSLIGYLYGAEALYALPQLTVIALQTSSFIFAISAAIVISVPEVGLVRLMTEDGPAGVMIRRGVPAMIILPVVLGMIRLAGEQAGLYDLAFGTATRTLAEIALLLALLWWTGHAVSRQSRRVSERERTIRVSENRFIRFMQNLPGLAWIKDSEGRYVFANESARKAFGRTRDMLYGKTDSEVFPPEIAAAFVENDRRALASGTGTQAIEELADDSGIVRHSIVSKFPIDVGTDAPLIGGIAIEITEQIRAQQIQEFLFSITEKIRVSRNADDLLADISESLGKYLGVHRCLFNEIDIDADAEIVQRDYARDGEHVAGRHKLSDYSAAASESMCSGKTVVNRDSKTDPRTAEYFEKTYGPNKELSYIAVPMMREGRWVASLWCSDDKPHEWTDHETALLENVAERAWTAVERLRAEEALQMSYAEIERQRRLYDTILSNTPDLAYVFDLDHRFTYVNDVLLRMWGKTLDEAIGKNCLELGYEPWHAEMHDREIEQVKAAKQPVRGEVPFTGTFGRRIYDYIFVPIIGADGVVEAIAGTTRDVTEIKQSESNAEFLAEISQELVRLTSTDEMMSVVGAKTGAYLNLSLCAFAEISEAADVGVVTHDWHREDVPSVVGTYRLDEFLDEDFQRAGRAGEIFVVRDCFADPRTDGDGYRAIGVGSFVCVPLVRAGEWRFLLAICDSEARDWRDDEIELIREIAERIWTRLERARAEEALRENEERYRSLFESAPMAIFVCDSNAVIQHYNAVAAELWGREPVCGIEKHCGSIKLWLTDGTLLPHDQSPMVEVLRTGEAATNVEVFIERPDGSRLPVLVNFAALRDSAGAVTGAITSFIDITELKQAEEHLERYRILTEKTQDVVWMLRPDGAFIEVNQAAMDTYGYSREEFMRMNVAELREASTLNTLPGQLNQACDGGTRFETVHRRKDGTTIDVEVNATSARFGGEPFILSILRDITERKRRENSKALLARVADVLVR